MSNSVSGNPEQECDTNPELWECELDGIIVTPEDYWMDDPFFDPESVSEEDDGGGLYPPQPEDTECHVFYGCGGGVGGGNSGDDDELQKWEDEKIIDDELDPCMQSIVQDLKGIEEGVGEIIQKFAGETPGYNWELKSGNLNGQTAQTNPPALYDPARESITTVFDNTGWPDATNISWARTILHEAIHAYLVVYFQVNRPDWIATYPEMVEQWGEFQNWNDVHHEEIARSLVGEIAIALKEFGDSSGLNYDLQFYRDLSWGGLHTTEAFLNKEPSEKDRIQNILSIELTGYNLSGSPSTQRGSNIDC